MPGGKVVTQIDPDILSAEDKAKAINTVKLIKKKKTKQSRAEHVMMGAIRKYTWQSMKVSHRLMYLWN